MEDKITILTESTVKCSKVNIQKIKRIIRNIPYSIEHFVCYRHLPYSLEGRGPSAVLRSLIEGFKSEGIIFNFNPKDIKKIGGVVVVLSNTNALKEAIELKKAGKIQKLLAGPNLMVWPDEFDGILASAEIDVCLVPCEWVRLAYEEIKPSLKGRIRVWYSGVDEKFWQPKNLAESKDVLIYWKTEKEEFISHIKNKLREYNWKAYTIQYGKYCTREFKKRLSGAKFAVFVSKSESQGIALAESWAMNVPTLVWSTDNVEIKGRVFPNTSSVPYLNSTVGWSWKTIEDLECLLKNINSYAFGPRRWVLKNMTDKISAQLMLRIINSIVVEK